MLNLNFRTHIVVVFVAAFLSGCFNSPVVPSADGGSDISQLPDSSTADAADATVQPTDICATLDLCGELLVGDENIDCGTCDGGRICHDSRCECPVPECIAGSCGEVSNDCGTTVDCGICSAIETCTDNACICEPSTCASLGATCGTIPDGCGDVLSCGECVSPEPNCGGGGPNTCGPNPCLPATCQGLDKNCGAVGDGCGATLDCGTCNVPEICGALSSNVCGCIPESNSEFCARNASECGTTTATDNCGVQRTVDCGACVLQFDVCTNNQCDCVPQTNSELCASNAPMCGTLTLVDRCGTSKSLTCGCASGVCFLGECCIRRKCLQTDCGEYPDNCGGTIMCGMDPCQ